jgi:hypothetical protein
MVSLVHVLRAQPISDAAHTSASRIWLVVRGLELVATQNVARAVSSGSEAWTRLSCKMGKEPRAWTSERNILGGRNFSRFPLSQSALKKNSRASGVAWGSRKFFRSSWLEELPPIPKRTTVVDRRVLNSKCPKRVGCFGYNTDFLKRKGSIEWYRFDKKIMSLFYAKNSDEIGCALHVFLHVKRNVRYLDSRSYVCMRVYARY